MLLISFHETLRAAIMRIWKISIFKLSEAAVSEVLQMFYKIGAAVN